MIGTSATMTTWVPTLGVRTLLIATDLQNLDQASLLAKATVPIHADETGDGSCKIIVGVGYR
jgi:hypothetical protein